MLYTLGSSKLLVRAIVSRKVIGAGFNVKTSGFGINITFGLLIPTLKFMPSGCMRAAVWAARAGDDIFILSVILDALRAYTGPVWDNVGGLIVRRSTTCTGRNSPGFGGM